MAEQILMVGSGGHAAVLAEALTAHGHAIDGVVTAPTGAVHATLAHLPRLTDDEFAERYTADQVVLVNGLGSVPGNHRRTSIFDDFRARGFRFLTVVSPFAVVSASVTLAEGAQVMAGAVIQTAATIGPNAIVNTGAIIDHDTVLGAHVHVAPRAALSGGVQVADRVHIGTGASVIQGISLGAGCVIGAGASVVRDVSAGAILLPAKPTLRDEGVQ